MSHTIHKRRAARVPALLAALALAVVAVLMAASPAQAHDALIGTDPADGSTVAALPAQLTLTFSAEIADDDGASEMQVTDAAGTTLTDGAPSVSDNVLTQPLAGDASGVVTVLWKVVSSDGHPTSGQFTFTVEGAPAPAPSESATTAPTPTETTPAPEASEGFTPGPPMETSDDDAAAWPWIVAGVIVVAALGGIAYLLVSRSRRQKALAELSRDGSQDAAGPAAEPGSGPGSDH